MTTVPMSQQSGPQPGAADCLTGPQQRSGQALPRELGQSGFLRVGNSEATSSACSEQDTSIFKISRR